jgi:hypothetical protein
VDVPDCEVVICSLYNPRLTLLPEEAETYKRKCLLNGKELITFLCQHDLDVNPEMVRLPLVLPNFSHVMLFALFLHCGAILISFFSLSRLYQA